MNLKARMLCSFISIFMVIVAMFSSTFYVTSMQKHDGLVINLSGRQRMLSQKIAKEALKLSFAKNKSAAQNDLQTSMTLFETTLNALINSGYAPVTLNPSGAKKHLPAATGAVLTQLHKVQTNWTAYKKLVNASYSGNEATLNDLSAQSMVVLKSMNKAVGMLQKEADEHVQTLMLLQITFIIIGSALLCIVVVNLRKHLFHPLDDLRAFANKISSGELHATINATYLHEFENLKNDTVSMVATLNSLMEKAEESSTEAKHNAQLTEDALATAQEKEHRISSIVSTIRTVAEKAKHISTRVDESIHTLTTEVSGVNNDVEIQRERMRETSTAMSQMNSTVIEVASNASNAAQLANDSKERAEEGAAGVQQAVNSIGLIQDSIVALKESMLQLGKQTDSISEVMNVINDIADQTNLLALNAAIEAARAGEAGKGFAVVADEVRKLAEKTMMATHDVGDAITQIQAQAHTNIEAVENAAIEITASTDAADSAGQSMEHIVSITYDTAQQITSIATASEEQAAVSEQIEHAVTTVAGIAEETATGMAKASVELEEISALTAELDHLLDDMQQEAAPSNA
ncbi:methyl-accepting chemotaxis protein [Halodesulfovibrio sp.]|uniref:methyl-accepting chemotaxis protein n=1 Tax=Halodesulfovibrio sp. TaxID=1912772 RepID=UPI002600C14E|nr:methyl-accepting chemotaxis protein [Halodesulfovibrio sp.]MCT4535675.1 methyl-accepting chemotaxis protein [Halodesulfovibrio sp.]